MAAGDPDEAQAAIAILGASGVALLMGLRAICGIFQRRERDEGRKLTAEEVDAIMVVTAAHPALAQAVAGIRADLDAITERLDEMARRLPRRRPIDG